MAKLKTRSAIRNSTLLEFIQGDHYWRGFSTKGDKNYYPYKPKRRCTQEFHAGHLSLLKCLHRVNKTTYWSGLYDQIHKLLTNCQTCSKFSNNNCKQLQSKHLGHEMPLVPCSKLTTNIFHFKNCLYLLAEDYSSRFLVIRRLDRMTAKHVTSHIQVIFS